MAVGTYIASTVVMALLGVGVFYAAVHGRPWKRYAPRAGPAGGSRGVASDTRTWIALFVGLSLAAVVGIVGILQSGADSTILIVGGAGAIIVAFLAIGTYSAARSRGHPYSLAIGETLGVLGAVVLLAMVVNLVTRFGP
jgi:hypothetical protein